MIKYKNDTILDSRSLGFSESEADNSIQELKDYLNLISPNKKLTILNDEPDFDISKKLN